MPSNDLAPWSERILESLPATGMTTTGQIVAWLQNNTFRLNSAFETQYAYTSSGIVPALLANHSGVYEEMFLCYLWRKRSIAFLGVGGADLVESEAHNQGRQRFVSKNERAKTYRSHAKDCEENLAKLIRLISDAEVVGPIASQILFSDRENMIYGDGSFSLPRGSYSSHNTVFSRLYTYNK